MAERIIDVNNIGVDDDIFNIDFEEERVFEHRRKKWVRYLNITATWDTETTSFINNGLKVGYCYVWAMKIDNTIVTGRYLSEFEDLCHKLSVAYELNTYRRLIIWVHNLGFDFQFARKYFEFSNIFAMDRYKPIKALTISGIEFRDSYILTNSSLEEVAKTLSTCSELTKLKGDLDYDLLRHSETIITDKEWEYIYNDVRIVYQLIKERTADEDGVMTNIPMTSTGYVRRHVKSLCLPKGSDKATTKKRNAYKRLMSSLTIEYDEYSMLKDAFQGGFTHANAYKVSERSEFTHVGSFDITSSYPTVCCSRYFPMTKGKIIDCETLTEEQFNDYLKYYCCLINATFYDIEPRLDYDNLISFSRCDDISDDELNNGRVIKASELTTTFTETDLKSYKKFYKWSGMCVNKLIIYGKGYLPEPIITSILDLYEKKTSLKGVVGREKEYNNAKALLNAIYGMMVTDIVRDETIYGNDWDTSTADVRSCIDIYNKSVNRFLFYPWGVWVTAYARERLFEMIEACGDDYIYSDTDSVKILNPEKHVSFIEMKNEEILCDIEEVLSDRGIDISRAKPKNIKGVEKPLGVWDFEGVYKKFKTLGAKRYFVLKEDDEYELTVAGVNKKKGVQYILDKASRENKSPFEVFDFNLIFDGEYTGKKSHIYVNDEIEGYMTDYNGVISHFDSKSSVYLESASYNMSLAIDYSLLLNTIMCNKSEKLIKRKLGI